MSKSKHERTKRSKTHQTKNPRNKKIDSSNSSPIDTLGSIAQSNVNTPETSVTAATTSQEIKLNQKQQQQCDKYKISLERVKSEAHALINLGYTPPQALKVIIRKSSKRTVATLIKLHPILTSKQYDEFSREDLIKIAARDGGSKNLEAIKTNFDTLKQLTLNSKDMIKMVAHHGGSKNLAAVKENFETLKQLEFTPEDIITMVSHDGGSINLVAVKNNFDALKQLKFKPKDIIRIVSHHGGSINLIAVKENYEALKQLEFTPEDIIKMVAHDGGSINLATVKENFEALKQLGFTSEDIIKIVSHGGGSKNLLAVKENLDALKQLEFKSKDIIKIVSHDGGSNNLVAVKNNFEALKQLGFKPNDSIKMVAYHGGSNNLVAVKNNFEALKQLEFKPEDIIKMVSHIGGSKNLVVVQENFGLLKLMGFTPEDMIKMVSYHGGSNNLIAVKNNVEALKQLGFKLEDIIKIVSHHGGATNLVTVKENIETLKRLGFTQEDMIKIVSRDGGSNDLTAVKENFEALKQLGFTPKDMIKMVSHKSGANNLVTVKENFETLKQLGFTPKDMIKIVSHDSGSINLIAIINCYELLKESTLKTSQIANYFAIGSKGRELLNKALELSSKQISTANLLDDEIKAQYFQRVKNIQSVILNKQWITHIKHQNNLVIVEVSPDYSAKQIQYILNYCYKRNGAMRSWCNQVILPSACSIGLKLHRRADFISDDAILSTLKFFLYINRYTLQINYGTFLKQLKYTQSMDAPEAAIVSFDQLCLKFEKEYPSITQEIMKSLFADFFIGLVKEQFKTLNQTQEEKYESFELIKSSHSVLIDNYSAFEAFYSELRLEPISQTATHPNRSPQSVDSTRLMQNLFQQSNSSNQSYKRAATVHEDEPSSIRQRLGEPSEPIQYREIQQQTKPLQEFANGEESFGIDLDEFLSLNTVWNNEELQSFTFFNSTEQSSLPLNNAIDVIMDEETNNILDFIFEQN